MIEINDALIPDLNVENIANTNNVENNISILAEELINKAILDIADQNIQHFVSGLKTAASLCVEEKDVSDQKFEAALILLNNNNQVAIATTLTEYNSVMKLALSFKLSRRILICKFKCLYENRQILNVYMHYTGGISLFEAYHSDLKTSTLIIPNDRKLAIKAAKANVARYYRALQHTFSISSKQADTDGDGMQDLDEDDLEQENDANDDEDYRNSQVSLLSSPLNDSSQNESRSSGQSQPSQSTQNSSDSTSKV